MQSSKFTCRREPKGDMSITTTSSHHTPGIANHTSHALFWQYSYVEGCSIGSGKRLEF